MKVYTAQEQMSGFRKLNQELDAASKLVETMEEECTKRALDVLEAEKRYKIRYYKTMLNYREEKDSRARSEAEVAAADQEHEWKKAKVLHASAKEALATAREQVKSIRQRMSNYQSVSSMARVEADLAGRG